MPADPLAALQGAIADLDPEARLVSYVVVAEWLEPDGSPSLAVMHCPMPPWHLDGMLSYAREHAQQFHDFVFEVDGEDVGDDDF